MASPEASEPSPAGDVPAGGRRPLEGPGRATARAALPVPPDLDAALDRNREARVIFDAFSPSHRQEYIRWIAEAKREATRTKRIAAALEKIAGKRSRTVPRVQEPRA